MVMVTLVYSASNRSVCDTEGGVLGHDQLLVYSI